METEEREMLRDLASRLLASDRPDDLWIELVESGMVEEVWADDLAVALLFQEHGRATAATSLLDHYVLRAEAPLEGRLVLPPLGSSAASGRCGPHGIKVDGLVLAADHDAAYLVGTDAGDVFVVDADDVAVEHLPGFDPDLRVGRITGTVPAATARPLSGADWPALGARAAHALAFELVGIAHAALDRAVAHVLERQQFGRPLAAFQVVRHRLATAAIATSGAEELALASGPDLGLDEATLVVKAVAGRAALTATAEALQVCGGMGFTAEFGLHGLVRRAYLLDSLFGGCETAEADLGAAALTAGRIPEPAVALAKESVDA